jgi:large subunit ribosomal protein L2
MPLKDFNPTSPGQRGRISLTFEEVSKKEPEKSLISPLKKNAGRNNQGRITAGSRGGGCKRSYRQIDFFRADKDLIPATVTTIEYDPNRTVFIALLNYKDGEKRYILAASGLKVGDEVISGVNDIDIKIGNNLPLRQIPVGSFIHNVELTKGCGGIIARSAGSGCQLMGKEGNYGIIKMPSGEQRLINLDCRATIGILGNEDNKNISLGKAGRSRFLGIKPHVRGVAKNPCDHPHGGGEGKAPIGHPSPLSPWGKPTLGYKTGRKRSKKRSKKWIITPRQ